MKRILIPILALLLGLTVAFGMFRFGQADPQGASTPAASRTPTTPPEPSAPTREADPSGATKTPTPAAAASDPAGKTDTIPPEKTPEEGSIAGDVAGEISGGVSRDTSRDTSGDTSRDTSEDTSEDTSGGTSGGGDFRGGGLHVVPGTYDKWITLGSDDADNAQGYLLKVVFNGFGAGLQHITLAGYDHLIPAPGTNAPPYALLDLPLAYTGDQTPYIARYLWVNGTAVPLMDTKWPAKVDADAGTVTFRAVVADADDHPVAEVVRTYRLGRATDATPDAGYDLTVTQRLINRSDKPLDLRLSQNAQGDLPKDLGAYIRDMRIYVTAHFDPQYNAARDHIYTRDSYLDRSYVVDKRAIWPNPDLDTGQQLAWLASENRYFALVTHPPVDPTWTAADTPKVPPLTDTFPTVGVTGQNDDPVVLTLDSATHRLGPGAAADLSFGIYAGPREPDIFGQPPYSALGLNHLIRYNIGGMCAFCTFQWLAKGLLGLMSFFHMITGDWGVAIILLVCLVRLILHPITKRAQFNMMKMSKQMGALQPEMEKIKTKYKDDQSKLNAEMMKLYREKGVNPAGFLGCLPMLLQTPIWIALYAMLYFAIELRHEPAFYGVFQFISGGHWHFLQDLSISDSFIRFIPLTEPGLKIPFISGFTGEIRALNILPLLMGVVFFINQKFTTPPATNEQQAQQQKIMKFMVLLFPIFLYNAPAGLTLYITTSTLAGIADSYLVRKHIQQAEADGTLFTKKPRKPGGFMDKMGKVMEQKQMQLAAKQREAAKGTGRQAPTKKRKR